jgi:hypothetical protein
MQVEMIQGSPQISLEESLGMSRPVPCGVRLRRKSSGNTILASSDICREETSGENKQGRNEKINGRNKN